MQPTKPPSMQERLAAEGVEAKWFTVTNDQVQTFMRPKHLIYTRVQACLLRQSWGYSGSLAVIMKRVEKQGDPRVLEVLSPRGIWTLLAAEDMRHYKESAPDGTPRPNARYGRKYMREVLAAMDDDGIIDRVRMNCPPVKLIGLSYREALEGGLVTPFRDLSIAAKKKLSWKTIAIYLLAKPRPAKAYDLGSISDSDVPQKSGHPDPQLVEITEERRAKQLAFRFVPELKNDPKWAAELIARPDVQSEIALYHRTIDTATDQAEKRLSQFFQVVAKPKAAPSPKTNQPDLFTATVSDADASLVLDKLREFDPSAEKEAARRLVEGCRALNPQCTAVSICEAITVKAPLAKKNPAWFLVTAVPKMFIGGGVIAVKPAQRDADRWRQLRAKGWTVDQIRSAYKLEPPEPEATQLRRELEAIAREARHA